MRKLFSFILFLSVVMFAAAACNDKKDDGPDTSIGKAVEGTYPIVYTIAVESEEPAEGEPEPLQKYQSSVTVAKGSSISAILALYEGTPQEVRTSYATPMFAIGLPLQGVVGEITFRNPLLNEDGKEDGQPYKTTVYINGEKFEEASVRIEGTFDHYYGIDTAGGPSHFIEFTATITPKRTEEVPDPASFVITVRDSRLGDEQEPE